MNKSNNILLSIGIMFFAYGLFIMFFKENVYQSNINLNLVVPIINAITIISLLFSMSDVLQSYYKRVSMKVQIDELEKRIKAISDDNLFYKVMSNFVFDDKIIVGGFKYEFAKMVSNWLSNYAFSIGFALILSIVKFNDYVMTGVTIITFSMFIISFASNMNLDCYFQHRVKDITLNYYKNKNQ